MHLKAMEALGARITLEEGYVLAEAPPGGLIGGDAVDPHVGLGGRRFGRSGCGHRLRRSALGAVGAGAHRLESHQQEDDAEEQQHHHHGAQGQTG
jgi:hypothetical protein